MTVRVPWLDRKFELDFPVEEAPAILAQLRAAPDRLEALVRPVPDAKRVAKVGDKWSLQEHAGHLIDLDDLHLSRMDDYDQGVDFLRPADLTNRQTEEASWNSRSTEEVLAGFRAKRAELVRRLETLEPGRFGQTAIHPRLHVAMRIVDMMKFVVEHDEHHLQTIEELAE